MSSAGNRTGIVSGIMDTFIDDEPDIKSKLVVTDPAVFNRSRDLLKDWTSNRTEGQDFLRNWTQDFNAATPQVEAAGRQEVGFLDKFYDGSFSNYLQGLRNREGDARRAAGDRALQYVSGQQDRAAMLRGEPSGTSSATRAMGYRAARDIENDVALSALARERGDFDYINRMQLGNIGARGGILDALLTRKLLPKQLNDQELFRLIQTLGGISGIRQGASQPVLWRERSDLEKTSDFMDSLAEGAYKGANAFMTFSGMGVGMGGAGGLGGAAAGGAASGAGGGTAMNYSIPDAYMSGAGMSYNQQTPQWRQY